MLAHLSIRNFILIKSVEIPFLKGMCVLSGDTGSGKSILLDAISFAMGSRSSSSFIMHGQEKAQVILSYNINSTDKELISLLKDNDIDIEDDLIIRRLVYLDGKSKCFINDIPVSVTLLKNISVFLVELHRQHDQRVLLDNSECRKIIDSFGNLEKKVSEIKYIYLEYSNILKQIEEITKEKENTSRDRDYLSFVLQELEELSPVVGEEEKLDSKRRLLLNSQKLISVVEQSKELLSSDKGAISSIFSCQSLLLKNSDMHEKFNAVNELLERSYIEANEALNFLDNIFKDFDFENEDIDSIEKRLFDLRRLSRKYKMSSDNLVDYYLEIKNKINYFEDFDKKIFSLEKDLSVLRKEYIALSDEISSARKESALAFKEAVNNEIKLLKMANISFSVAVEDLEESDWLPSGKNKVGFFISSSASGALMPLLKTASGGELSRIMLGLKIVLANVRKTPLLVFDEIDSGVSGAISDLVGQRLLYLSSKVQIIVVTHQPQVASLSSYHIKVSKEFSNSEGYITNIAILDKNEKEMEIARMLSGSKITEEAKAAARCLMNLEA